VPARAAEALGVMMRPQAVARAGLLAMFRRNPIVIPGCLPKIFAFFMAILPMCLINCVRSRVSWLPQASKGLKGGVNLGLAEKLQGASQ